MQTDTNVPPSPALILRDILVARVQKNPRYSLRAFARDLGVSHGYLSSLLQEKKKLSVPRAHDFIRVLSLEASVADSLLHAVNESYKPLAGRPADVRKTAEAYHLLELELFKMVSEWYHVAILDLIHLSDFTPKADWIASRLGIRPHQAKTALRRLVRLGLLKEENGNYVKTHATLELNTRHSEEAIRRFHRQMIEKALVALRSTRPQHFARRDITGMTMPINTSRIPEARKRIARFQKNLIAFLSEGECDELFQLNVQLFALSRPK